MGIELSGWDNEKRADLRLVSLPLGLMNTGRFLLYHLFGYPESGVETVGVFAACGGIGGLAAATTLDFFAGGADDIAGIETCVGTVFAESHEQGRLSTVDAAEYNGHVRILRCEGEHGIFELAEISVHSANQEWR